MGAVVPVILSNNTGYHRVRKQNGDAKQVIRSKNAGLD